MTRNRCLVLALAIAALVATAADALAVPTFYTTRAGFDGDTRTGSTTFEDFEPTTALGAPGFVLDTGPYDSTGVGSTAFAAGDIVAGISVSDAGGMATVNGLASFFPLSTTAVGHSTGAQFGGLTTITFQAGTEVTAVGFDAFVTSGVGGPTASTISVQAFDSTGTAIFAVAQTVTSSTTAYVFAGVVVDEAISRVTVTTTGNQVVLIDNLVFNPEPSSWALMALGIGGLVAVVRRRRPRRA